MAVKLQVNAADGKQKKSNKRLLMMLLIVAILTVWTLLKQDESDTDAIELANPIVISSHSALISKNLNAHKNRLNNQQGNGVFEQKKLVNNNAIAWQKLQRQPLASQPHDVFKVHSWLVVPKPIKTKPLPPPPPLAPPAPFTYMGKLEGSPQGTQVFLMRNGHLYTTIKGQNIDAQWRLDDEDMNNIQLTYLPLNLPQVLSKMAKSFESIGQATTDTPAVEMNL